MNSWDNACLVPFPSSEETPSVSIERLSSFTTVSGKEYFHSSTSNPCLTGGDAHLRASYQSDRFPNASSQSTSRNKPEFISDQGQHEGVFCCNEGCHRQIETRPMSREGEIDLFCSDHQSSDVIATRTAHCQFTECLNTPKYGQQKGPLKFCQHHKRAGMYTNRNGQILLATRDGSAFKDDDETEAVSAAKSPKLFTARGMRRPRFCSRHKKKGMVGLKNRPCIFPGCKTKPHYGLLGCRPIYCAKHKKANNTVHLPTEATTRETMGVTSELGEKIKTTPGPICSNSKRLLSATCSKEGQLSRKEHKKYAPTFQVEDDQELDNIKGADDASLLPLPGLLQPQRKKKKESGKGEISGRRKIMSSIQTASPSSTSTGTCTSSNKCNALAASTEVAIPIETRETGEWGSTPGASTSLPAKTENARLADTLDMKTSFEVKALEDIRESAQADAATRGTERRARVPSRKALEASGKLKTEGIQWLTKERREEEARRTKEFRAQRKAAAAAGLRAGQVIEAATIGPTFDAGSANCAGDVSKPELTKMIWRKLSPAKILQVAARMFTTNEVETAPDGGGEVASGEEKVNGDKWKDGAKDALAGTSEGKHTETVRTPRGTARMVTLKFDTPCPQDAIHREECYGNQSVQSRQVIPSPDRKETHQFSGWGSIDIYASTAGAAEVDGMKVCQFEDCSKRARFGINGIVRYCKLHSLFGMHRIDVPT